MAKRYDQIEVIKEARARRKRALAMRAKGLTVQQVGDQLGVTKQRASEILRRAKLEATQA